MAAFQGLFSTLWDNIVSIATTFTLRDALDVAIVAYIFYHAMRLIRETRAMQLVKSIAVIFLVYFLADAFNMITLRYLLQMVLNAGLVVIIVLFQPEIRRALEQLGRSKISDVTLFGTRSTADEAEREQAKELIEIVAESCERLSASKTGALMVIERKIRLGEIIKTGTIIDSAPSPELIGNIFFTNSPLHDGAMVLRDNRLYAAGCFLPISDNAEIGRELGTRHRAALGVSEVSDAVVVVVSEETGAISVALDARLQRGLSVQNLKKLLNVKLIPAEPQEGQARKKVPFWKVKK